MLPRRETRGRLQTQAEPSTLEENPDSSSGDVVAKALSRVAEVLQHVTRTNYREEHCPETKGDQVLERFLKFNPSPFHGRPDSEQEAEAWVKQMEDMFAALNYANQRKVQFVTFRLRGPARDWWLRKKEAYEREQRTWS
jgi:hypothetical protein